jgi:hypothetical protein
MHLFIPSGCRKQIIKLRIAFERDKCRIAGYFGALERIDANRLLEETHCRPASSMVHLNNCKARITICGIRVAGAQCVLHSGKGVAPQAFGLVETSRLT